jgi:hypothetical protein
MLGGMFQQDTDAMEGFEFTVDLLVKFRFMERKFNFAVLAR